MIFAFDFIIIKPLTHLRQSDILNISNETNDTHI